MNPLDAIFTVAGVGVWSWWMLGFDEWTDYHGDIDRARQERMGRLQLQKVRLIAWMGQYTLPIWGTGAATIAVVGFAVPDATNLAGILVGGVMWARSLGDEEEESLDIQQLRAALGDIVKDPDNPPLVTLEGEHPEGGPMRLIIGGHPDFKEYTKPHRDAVEHILEYRLKGDWEPVDWFGDGSSIWERVIHPPDQVDYPGHFDKLPNGEPWPWWQVPIGVDGLGNIAIMDLLEMVHWFIAGITRKGKTTILRALNIHLLRRKTPIIAFDVKGGLAYLRGREGVTIYTQRIENLGPGMRKVRKEVEDRTDQFERDGTYREDIVVEVDELAVACDRAYALGPDGKDKGARYPRFIADLLEVIRLGGQVGVHVVLATQRPGADVIPIEIKDQCEGRIALGALTLEVAKMMFESGWVRAMSTPDKKGRIDMGHASGEGCAWWQVYMTADPADTHHPEQARLQAEMLLPPISDDQIANNGGAGSHESDATVRIKDLDKSRTDAHRETHVGAGQGARAGVSTDRAIVALFEQVERSRASSRERSRRSLDKLRGELAADPNHEKHGTERGRRVCWCEVCRPKPVKVPS